MIFFEKNCQEKFISKNVILLQLQKIILMLLLLNSIKYIIFENFIIEISISLIIKRINI